MVLANRSNKKGMVQGARVTSCVSVSCGLQGSILEQDLQGGIRMGIRNHCDQLEAISDSCRSCLTRGL
jgi:hypothetical protein